MKLLTTETETLIIDIATKLSSPMLCYDAEIHPKVKRGTIMERYECVPRNFQGTGPEPLRTNRDHIEDVITILADF